MRRMRKEDREKDTADFLDSLLLAECLTPHCEEGRACLARQDQDACSETLRCRQKDRERRATQRLVGIQGEIHTVEEAGRESRRAKRKESATWTSSFVPEEQARERERKKTKMSRSPARRRACVGSQNIREKEEVVLSS